MTLELKKFNMREITFKADENKGPVIVMIGRRDTGKSFLIRELKLVMDFIQNMFLNYLFMMNIIQY